MRWRAAAGLTDRREHACPEQHSKVQRHAARARRRAPQRARPREHVAAARPIGPCGERNAEERIENRERQARENAELRVGGVELALDRLQRRGQHLGTIGDVGHVADRQQREDVVPVPLLGQQSRCLRLATRCLRLAARYSRLAARYSRLAGRDSRLAARYLRLAARYSRLAWYWVPRIRYSGLFLSESRVPSTEYRWIPGLIPLGDWRHIDAIDYVLNAESASK